MKNVGRKVYYSGDMANNPGFGEVIGFLPATKYSPPQYKIRLEARNFIDDVTGDVVPELSTPERSRIVWTIAFRPGPGQRFFWRDEWERDRAEKIRQMQERMAKVRN